MFFVKIAAMRPRRPSNTLFYTNTGEYDLTNPEIFQVTNYINDLSIENTQVLMTSDVDGNYHGVYTYDNTGSDLISSRIWDMLREYLTARCTM